MDTMTNTTTPIDIYEDKTTLRDIVRAKTTDLQREELDDAFYIVDLGKVVTQYNKWTQLIPRVQPFYAMKCNPDTALLKVLAALGTGFDCASKTELMASLDLNVAPTNMIYANPCKQESHLRFAKQKDISLMTFDSEEELCKINKHYPQARSALIPLSCKYGCELDRAPHLLKVAKQMDLNVVGVSFHVGSATQVSNSYREPIRNARLVFDQAQSLGFQMELLDIGGGFPGDILTVLAEPFEKFADVINRQLEQFFPSSAYLSLRIISEPGRYFAGPVCTLVLNVVATRCIDYKQNNNTEASGEHTSSWFMYYLNDGVYGSFVTLQKNRLDTLVPSLLNERGIDEPTFPSIIWGQTCDGTDCITKRCYMHKLAVGEWVYFEAIGAYSLSLSSNFNGFSRPHCYYVAPKQILSLLQEVFKVADVSKKISKP